MLIIKRLSMRNFFSFGNAAQIIDFDNTELALILGQNNDASPGDDNTGMRNGVGKSAIVHGLVFGLYGKSIDNSIKIPNLINKINKKNCEVTIDFEKDGISYRVERGRSPTFFNFYKIHNNESENESRGEMKDTQEELTEILGISQLLFEHIVVLNTNVSPFLALPQGKQREMIEELVSITQLTEKANLLKDMYKETKRLAEQEKFKIDTISSSNQKIEKSIETLQNQSDFFESKKKSKIIDIEKSLLDFDGINWEELVNLASTKQLAIENNHIFDSISQKLSDITIKRDKFQESVQLDKIKIQNEISKLENIDIVKELENHEELDMWNTLKVMLQTSLSTKRLLDQQLSSNNNTLNTTQSLLKLECSKLADIEEKTCPLCKQDLMHIDNHMEMKNKVLDNIETLKNTILTIESEIIDINKKISELEIFDMPEKPVTFYSTSSEAKLHEHKLESLRTQYNEVRNNPYDTDVKELSTELSTLSLVEIPDAFDLNEVNMLQYQYKTLISDLNRENEISNPYYEQIQTLTNESIQRVDYDEYNKLAKIAEHQDFLAKLLMNKDSHVRKRIIEQNISFLNIRLAYYIEKSGSQHSVEFMNDLSVDITLMGMSYDFHQLSRGEKTRIVIALNLAFRDTFESLYQSINIMIVDEVIDQGLDTSGVECAWYMLQDLSTIRGKNIFVVSHREELMNKANCILKVVKEDGFSSVEFCDALDL